MYTIVALGNPGEEYRETRHNAGWLVLESLHSTLALPTPTRDRSLNAEVSVGTIGGQSAQLVYPRTFMNRTGECVAALAREERLGTLIVVHDDIDIPLGEVVVAYDRGAAGHNGVRSIIDALGHQKFLRVRIGIGRTGLFARWRRPQGDALSDYVLGRLTRSEMTALASVTPRVQRALELLCSKDFTTAAAAVNGQSAL